jgi:hypothetical protein
MSTLSPAETAEGRSRGWSAWSRRSKHQDMRALPGAGFAPDARDLFQRYGAAGLLLQDPPLP